jgi:hypothetical protein
MGNRREAETEITAPSLACFTRRSLLPSCTQTARISLTRYDTLNCLGTHSCGSGPIIINYWMGHEGKDMATLYGGQLTGADMEDVKWRQESAEKANLGFTLPELVGQTGQTPLERVAA